MKVLVTGATGFVGQHVVRSLLERSHSVTAVARNSTRASSFDWYEKVRFVTCNVHDEALDPRSRFGEADAVIHLAWPGLPHYKEMFHVERNLPADFRFLRNMAYSGYHHVLVTGTCLEYGMQSGCLIETTETRPAIPYALAKDSLRKFLQALQAVQPFRLQWARLFYMYGDGQNSNSLLAQLDRAIDRREESFNMSGGEQLRDYMPVTEVARRLVKLVEHADADGITNICSGRPISVRRLVEEHLISRRAQIHLNLGHFPYPDYEPMAFWGGSKRRLDD